MVTWTETDPDGTGVITKKDVAIRSWFADNTINLPPPVEREVPAISSPRPKAHGGLAPLPSGSERTVFVPELREVMKDYQKSYDK